MGILQPRSIARRSPSTTRSRVSLHPLANSISMLISNRLVHNLDWRWWKERKGQEATRRADDEGLRRSVRHDRGRFGLGGSSGVYPSKKCDPQFAFLFSIDTLLNGLDAALLVHVLFCSRMHLGLRICFIVIWFLPVAATGGAT